MRKSVALLTFAIVLKIALLFVFHGKTENNGNNNNRTSIDRTAMKTPIQQQKKQQTTKSVSAY